jgi:hypothetical protein
LLDSVIFALEGEVRWLDHVEATVFRRGRLVAPVRPRRAVRPLAERRAERSER